MFLEQPVHLDIQKVLTNKLLNKQTLGDELLAWDDTEMVR